MAALVVQCVVGTSDQIRAGEGESAVTVGQAAARLGVSEGTVYNLMRRGEIAFCARFAGTHLLYERDVERLRAERER